MASGYHCWLVVWGVIDSESHNSGDLSAEARVAVSELDMMLGYWDWCLIPIPSQIILDGAEC